LRPAFQHHDVGPFGGEVLVAALGNRRVLGFPKGIGVGEEAILAEQIAGDLLGEGGKVEQGELGADGGTAEQPLCRACNYADHPATMGYFPRLWGQRARDNLTVTSPWPKADVRSL
jgi:hypothetical protein